MPHLHGGSVCPKSFRFSILPNSSLYFFEIYAIIIVIVFNLYGDKTKC